MEIEFRPEGIYLPAIDLWLDPRTPVESAWLSHAHSDHARGLHATVIATRITAGIYRHRWPLPEGRAQQGLRLDPGQTLEFRGARLTALRAAHILGAAQLLIEYGGERTVYTGDIKLAEPICGWATEIVPCDRLIVESTFALPIYDFLTAAEAQRRIVRFAGEAMAAGLVPVFLGYGLGRGQEIVHTLTAAGLPCAVHGAIAGLIPYYEAEGIPFPGWAPYERRKDETRPLVITPGLQDSLAVPAARTRVALVSGWAAVDSARARSGADVLIPYSDHAGFPELLAIVEQSGARRIDIVHGYAEPFARLLRQRGWAAAAAGTAAGEVQV
ncbi:MAG: MBL fold metallo-hydrolase [Acidobacteriota bacterium]